jgi:predicted nucleotidyltransferase
MVTNIRIPEDEIADFCQRHDIRKLSLFGSVLRDDFREDIDIDVLIEYETGAIVTLLDMASQEIELRKLLGRKVDLRTPPEISRYFRQQVIEAAELLYG